VQVGLQMGLLLITDQCCGAGALVKFYWKPSCGKKETCGLQMGLRVCTCSLLFVVVGRETAVAVTVPGSNHSLAADCVHTPASRTDNHCLVSPLPCRCEVPA
jgi:hypothetical protein